MTLHERGGLTRAQLRLGSGKGTAVADQHFHEVAGSRDFYIYVTPRARPKGYEELKTFLESLGYRVSVSDHAPLMPAQGYKAVTITAGTSIISEEALRRAHRWAHQRNFLHSFFKPLQAR